MQISKESHLVTLINVFETTPEQQQALIDQWIRFTEVVRNETMPTGDPRRTLMPS